MDGDPPLGVVQVKGDTRRGPVVEVEAAEGQTRSNEQPNQERGGVRGDAARGAGASANKPTLINIS